MVVVVAVVVFNGLLCSKSITFKIHLIVHIILSIVNGDLLMHLVNDGNLGYCVLCKSETDLCAY